MAFVNGLDGDSIMGPFDYFLRFYNSGLSDTQVTLRCWGPNVILEYYDVSSSFIASVIIEIEQVQQGTYLPPDTSSSSFDGEPVQSVIGVRISYVKYTNSR